jgi:integrase
MASITQLKNGSKIIQLYDAEGERQTLRIGEIPMRDAVKIRDKIEDLNNAKINGTSLPLETATWLAERPAKFYDRLVKIGLVEPRADAAKAIMPTLEPFLNEYIAKRTDVKVSTATVYRRTRKHLLGYFGSSKPIDGITEADADDWRLWLADKQKLAKNTIGRTCGIAKQFFRPAVKRRLISENPFAELSAQVGGNKERLFFVKRETAKKVLDCCHNLEFRDMFALGRFGGVRVPSESNGLRWGDVDWERNRVTIHSPKTEHHAGKDEREIPLFPELRPHLEALYDSLIVKNGKAPEPDEWVIRKHRHDAPRTHMRRIIEKAGVTIWPKLFQNLRSTRETELAREFPLHVVCAWLGNTQLIAAKHYLQVTDADFDHATGTSEKALRYNAPQRSTPSPGVTTNVDFLEGNANPLTSVSDLVGGTGLEQIAILPKKTLLRKSSATIALRIAALIHSWNASSSHGQLCRNRSAGQCSYCWTPLLLPTQSNFTNKLSGCQRRIA